MDKHNEIIKLNKQIDRLKNSIKKQKYGLVWMDVPEAFEDDVENKLPILKEVPDLAINNDDGKPQHILIEGDNYHALTCLNYTHKRKIDIIYIDPPYNTGSDGFRYKDKRIISKFPDGTEVPKDHPFRHSYWLSFMRKRLELAKGLLKDEGTFFVSINEDEYAQLKLLCDEIFSPLNYLTTFTVKVRHDDRILKGDKDFHETTEFLIMYRKSNRFKTIKRVQDNTSISDYVYEIKELTNKPSKMKMGKKEVEIFKPSEYEIVKGNPDQDKLKKINIRGSIKEGNSSGRFFMAHLENLKDNMGYLYKVPNMGSDKDPHRYFLAPTSTTKLNGDYFQGVPLNRTDTKLVPYANYLDFEEEFNNVGPEGGVIFRNGKKPVEFIKYILSIGSWNKNSIILDFFAGSASTGHAVLEQNMIDNGRRQFILATNNENNIISDVTLPRINNVMNGYKQVKNQKEILYEVSLNLSTLKDNQSILQAIDKFEEEKIKSRYEKIDYEIKKDKFKITGIISKQGKIPPLGNSLKYYRSEFIGKNNVLETNDEDKLELAYNAGELLAIAENTHNSVKKNKYYQLFEDNLKERYTAVYFREELDQFDKFTEMVKKLDRKTIVYVFSWGADEFIEDFEGLKNIKIKTIPLPIVEIYKNIYNLGN